MRQNQNNFDDFSTDYREIHSKNIRISGKNSDYFSEHKVAEIKSVLDSVLDNDINNILDFGCGDGNCVFYFHKYFPHSSLCGVDISKKSIEIAKNRKIPHSKFSIFNGKRIEFSDNHFDLILISNVLHHAALHEPKNILSECQRVLKKDGNMFIFEHNPMNVFTRYIVKDCVFDRGVHLIKPRQITNILNGLGFRNIDVKYILFFPRSALFRILIPLEKSFGKIPIGAQYYISAQK